MPSVTFVIMKWPLKVIQAQSNCKFWSSDIKFSLVFHSCHRCLAPFDRTSKQTDDTATDNVVSCTPRHERKNLCRRCNWCLVRSVWHVQLGLFSLVALQPWASADRPADSRCFSRCFSRCCSRCSCCSSCCCYAAVCGWLASCTYTALNTVKQQAGLGESSNKNCSIQRLV